MADTVLSPSQLEVFNLCERRWGEIYLNGKRIPPQDSAQAGTKVHDLLEKYLRDGTPIDETITWKDYPIGLIAADMTQYLPLPGSVPDVELTLDLEVDGIKYTGRVDARTPDKVYDHKSSSNLRYAKSAKTLQEDIQALIYARWMDVDGELQWTTGQTKNEIKSKKVVLKVLRDEVRERFDRIVTPLAKRVLAAYEHGDVKKLDKNKNACRLYPPKGCPFQNECWRPSMATLKEKMEARIAAARAANENKVAPERAAAVAADMAAIAEAQAAAVDPINPPLVTSTGAPAEPITATTEVLPKKQRRKKSTEQALVESLEIVEKETRPMTQAEIASAPGLVGPGPTTTQFVEDKPIRILYVNAIPLESRSGLLYAHELIAKAAETVCADMETHHVKLIDFGKGGGALAAQLAADIRAMEPGFDLVLMAKNPEGRDVEATLCALAKNVVMGV